MLLTCKFRQGSASLMVGTVERKATNNQRAVVLATAALVTHLIH